MTGSQVAPDSPGAVLSLIRSGTTASRSDVAKALGISASTAAARVQALLDHGYLREAGEGASHGGRRPRRLEPRDDAGVVAAADLGSHHATLAVLDLGGRIRAEVQLPMRIADGPAAVLAWVHDQLTAMVAELTPAAPLRGIVIGVPGPVDARTGRVVSPSRMPGWHGTDVRVALAEHTDLPVLVDNDANLMALGEFHAHAEDAAHLVFVKAGTGIGCGVIASGRLHHGGAGAAGDISHLAVPGHADVACSCGRTGCLDTVASGAALVRDLAAAGVEVADASAVVELAADADPTATRLLRAAGRATGGVLAAVVNFFDPDVLVIGGQFGRAEAFVASVRSALYEQCLPMATDHLHITSTRTGRLAGVLGAGQLMLEYLFDPERVNQTVAS
jgi:predicted NBD/HSP70 family sugar kinase